MTTQASDAGIDLDVDLGVDELNRLLSAVDKDADVKPEEFRRRVREAFVEHPDAQGPTDDRSKDPAWGAVTWFANRVGMHFSTASQKMRGDLPIKVRDVLYLEAVEREAGTDE